MQLLVINSHVARIKITTFSGEDQTFFMFRTDNSETKLSRNAPAAAVTGV